MPKKSRQRKTQVNRSPKAQDGHSVFIAPSTHKTWQIAAICIFLAFITVFSFSGVRANNFVTMDDYGYVLDNL